MIPSKSDDFNFAMLDLSGVTPLRSASYGACLRAEKLLQRSVPLGAPIWEITMANPSAVARESVPMDLGVLTASDLADIAVAPREWLCPDLIPAGTVTMLGGDGGAGKSLLALQLAVAVVSGGEWIGRRVSSGRVVYFSAEDDGDELHRRIDAILAAEGLDYADIDGLTLLPRVGEDTILAEPHPERAGLRRTALLQKLDRLLAVERPTLLVLDTLADLHSGDENNRSHARQFVGLLKDLAIRHGCTVLLLAHPSLTGMNTKSGLSGSTAWNGSVRSRLYLDRPQGDDAAANPDRRVLTTKKANYGPTGQEIGLTWIAGRFVVDPPTSPLAARAASETAKRVFLKLLRLHLDLGLTVSAKPSPAYAPMVFARHSQREGCTKSAFSLAMQALLESREIVVAEHGRGASKRSHLEFPST